MESREILIIEDDSSVRALVQMVMEEEGYRVITAQNGREGLKILETKRPHLILLDMLMPVMDGWRFAAEYRLEHTRLAPIIVMTAAKDARQRAMEIGADDFISKPFELDALLATVKRVIHKSRTSFVA